MVSDSALRHGAAIDMAAQLATRPNQQMRLDALSAALSVDQADVMDTVADFESLFRLSRVDGHLGVALVKWPKLCFRYGMDGESCKASECHALHVCVNYLLGACGPDNANAAYAPCGLNHHFCLAGDPPPPPAHYGVAFRNENLLKPFELDGWPPAALRALLVTFEASLPLPSGVCAKYNDGGGGGCPRGADCPDFHACADFVLGGGCSAGRGACRLSHEPWKELNRKAVFASVGSNPVSGVSTTKGQLCARTRFRKLLLEKLRQRQSTAEGGGTSSGTTGADAGDPTSDSSSSMPSPSSSAETEDSCGLPDDPSTSVAGPSSTCVARHNDDLDSSSGPNAGPTTSGVGKGVENAPDRDSVTLVPALSTNLMGRSLAGDLTASTSGVSKVVGNADKLVVSILAPSTSANVSHKAVLGGTDALSATAVHLATSRSKPTDRSAPDNAVPSSLLQNCRTEKIGKTKVSAAEGGVLVMDLSNSSVGSTLPGSGGKREVSSGQSANAIKARSKPLPDPLPLDLSKGKQPSSSVKADAVCPAAATPIDLSTAPSSTSASRPPQNIPRRSKPQDSSCVPGVVAPRAANVVEKTDPTSGRTPAQGVRKDIVASTSSASSSSGLRPGSGKSVDSTDVVPSNGTSKDGRGMKRLPSLSSSVCGKVNKKPRVGTDVDSTASGDPQPRPSGVRSRNNQHNTGDARVKSSEVKGNDKVDSTTGKPGASDGRKSVKSGRLSEKRRQLILEGLESWSVRRLRRRFLKIVSPDPSDPKDASSRLTNAVLVRAPCIKALVKNDMSYEEFFLLRSVLRRAEKKLLLRDKSSARSILNKRKNRKKKIKARKKRPTMNLAPAELDGWSVERLRKFFLGTLGEYRFGAEKVRVPGLLMWTTPTREMLAVKGMSGADFRALSSALKKAEEADAAAAATPGADRPPPPHAPILSPDVLSGWSYDELRRLAVDIMPAAEDGSRSPPDTALELVDRLERACRLGVVEDDRGLTADGFDFLTWALVHRDPGTSSVSRGKNGPEGEVSKSVPSSKKMSETRSSAGKKDKGGSSAGATAESSGADAGFGPSDVNAAASDNLGPAPSSSAAGKTSGTSSTSATDQPESSAEVEQITKGQLSSAVADPSPSPSSSSTGTAAAAPAAASPEATTKYWDMKSSLEFLESMSRTASTEELREWMENLRWRLQNFERQFGEQKPPADVWAGGPLTSGPWSQRPHNAVPGHSAAPPSKPPPLPSKPNPPGSHGPSKTRQFVPYPSSYPVSRGSHPPGKFPQFSTPGPLQRPVQIGTPSLQPVNSANQVLPGTSYSGPARSWPAVNVLRPPPAHQSSTLRPPPSAHPMPPSTHPMPPFAHPMLPSAHPMPPSALSMPTSAPSGSGMGVQPRAFVPQVSQAGGGRGGSSAGAVPITKLTVADVTAAVNAASAAGGTVVDATGKITVTTVASTAAGATTITVTAAPFGKVNVTVAPPIPWFRADFSYSGTPHLGHTASCVQFRVREGEVDEDLFPIWNESLEVGMSLKCGRIGLPAVDAAEMVKFAEKYPESVLPASMEQGDAMALKSFRKPPNDGWKLLVRDVPLSLTRAETNCGVYECKLNNDGTVTAWRYREGPDSEWQLLTGTFNGITFGLAASVLLEGIRAANPDAVVRLHSFGLVGCVVSVSAMRLTHPCGKVWQLERSPVSVSPAVEPSWIPMLASGLPRAVIVPIRKDDPEYVRELAPRIYDGKGFYVGRDRVRFHECRIIQVFRVQNPRRLARFRDRRDEMRAMYAPFGAEAPLETLLLFHGTRPGSLAPICLDNFEWRRAGESVGTKYGKGVYFAPHFPLSTTYAPECAPSDASRVLAGRRRFVFAADVHVGLRVVGDKRMAYPPMWRNDVRYDTAVDRLDRPSAIVKFEADEMYPKYLIEFEIKVKTGSADVADPAAGPSTSTSSSSVGTKGTPTAGVKK